MRDPLVSFIRGCAILMVLLVHSMWHFDLSTLPSLILKFGQMGCQAFFVLSSFCLCMSYRQGGITEIGHFYKKRFLSIAPGYWLTMTLNICAYFLFRLIASVEFMHVNTKLSDVAINTLLLQGLVPSLQAKNFVVYGGWFVGVMVLFYMIFPLLHAVYFYSNTLWQHIRVVAFPMIAFLICISLLIMTADTNGDFYVINSSSRYFSFLNQLPAFIMGFPLYELSHGKRNSKRYLVGGVVLIVSIVVTFLSFYLPFWYPFRIGYILSPFAMAVAVSTIYYLFSSYYEKYSNKYLCRIIEHLGTNSYGIYLSHFWIMVGGIQAIVCLVPAITRASSSEHFFYLLLPVMTVASCILGCQYKKLIDLVKDVLGRMVITK